MRWWVLLAFAACHTPPARAPIACDIHRVTLVRTSPPNARGLLDPLTVLEGTYDDPERTGRLVALTEQMLHAQGYLDAKLAVARHAACGVELDVTGSLGPRYRIARLEFLTDDGFPDAQRRAIVATNLATVNAVGGTYREDLLGPRLAELIGTYQQRGWLKAQVGKPQVEYDHARGEISIRVPIDAGKRFKIGDVRPHRPEGAAAVAALGLHTGDWFDVTALRIAIDRASRKVGRTVELSPSTISDRGVVDMVVSFEAEQ